MMIWDILDIPYGGGHNHWDMEPESAENVDAVLRGFRTCTTASFHTVAIYCPFAMVGMIREQLVKNNYAYIQELVWLKPNHNLAGASFALIPSAGEVIVIAYSSADKSVLDRNWIQLSKNPLERPNVIVAPTVTKRKKDDVGHIINTHEKPSCIMSYLVPLFCIEGASVLVAGAGAMGDGIGVVACGHDAITIEKDPNQFKQMRVWLANHKLENEAHLVIPFEQLNSRLTAPPADASSVVVPHSCCRCEADIKGSNDGGKCSVCDEKLTFEVCFGKFGLSLPTCEVCQPVLEASISSSSTGSTTVGS